MTPGGSGGGGGGSGGGGGGGGGGGAGGGGSSSSSSSSSSGSGNRPPVGRQKSSGTLQRLLGVQLPGATGSGRHWSTKLREMRSGKLRELYAAMGGGSSRGAGGGGAAAAAAAAPSDEDAFAAELRNLLRGLKLENKLAAMRAWCEEEEVCDRV